MIDFNDEQREVYEGHVSSSHGRSDYTARVFAHGVAMERQRVLRLLVAITACEGDGRDLIARSDALRKVENPRAPF